MKKVILTFLSLVMYTVFVVPNCFGSYTGKPICMSKLHYSEIYNSENSEAGLDYKLKDGRNIYVCNQKDLEHIRERVNKGIDSYRGKFIILTSNIYLHNWNEPIGNNKYNFEGNFEGEGHTIFGFTGAPLFGCINKSTIAALTVKGRIFNIKFQAKTYLSFNERLRLTALGGIAKVAIDSVFENCENGCAVAGTDCVGGICGYIYNNARFSYCKNKGDLIGTGAVGGIFGAMYQGFSDYNCKKINLSFCKNSGAIKGKRACGGLIGYVQGLRDCKNFLTLENCTNSGSIEISEDDAGGFIGQAVAQVKVFNCINNGKLKGVNNVGGFCGILKAEDRLISSLEVKGSTNFEDVSGEKFVGGFLGYGHNMKVEKSENYGDVIGGECVGGISGRVYMLLFKGVLNEGNIIGNRCIGGLCGYCSRTFNLDAGVNRGRVVGRKYVGDLIGGTGKNFLPI